MKSVVVSSGKRGQQGPTSVCTAVQSWVQLPSITKTCLYIFDPLKPHFYIVKLGFTRVYIIFLISAHNIDCRYSLEPPRRGGSNEYQQSMFWAEMWKISEVFCLKIFIFFVVKFSVNLNRHVFVMLQMHWSLQTLQMESRDQGNSRQKYGTRWHRFT